MENVSTIRHIGQQAIWKEFDRIVAESTRKLLESFMEEERDAALGCGSHERTANRCGYRNGYENRWLETRRGRLRLRVPRVRGTEYPFRTLVFDAYQRRTREIENAVEHWVSTGQSTRAIERSLEVAFDYAFSAATVSRILAKIDRELAVYHERSLQHGYRIIYLDAKHGYVCRRRKSGRRGKKKKAVLLTCWGLRHEGTQELVDFMACEGEESEENWTRFLTHLERRGLRARNPWDMPLELIATDGDGGLEAALYMVYPHIPRQRCQFHKLQTIARHLVDFNNRGAILASASRIYQGISTQQEAKANLKQWVKEWKDTEPAAVKAFCRDFKRTLTHLNLEPKLWPRARTTNPIERFHAELEKVTAHAGAWQNLRSWERHVFVIWRKLQRSGYAPTKLNPLFTRSS